MVLVSPTEKPHCQKLSVSSKTKSLSKTKANCNDLWYKMHDRSPNYLTKNYFTAPVSLTGSHIGKSRLYLSDWSLAMRRGKKCMADHSIISHKIILQFMADYQNSFYVCLRVVQLTLSTRYGFIEIGIGAAVP